MNIDFTKYECNYKTCLNIDIILIVYIRFDFINMEKTVVFQKVC